MLSICSSFNELPFIQLTDSEQAVPFHSTSSQNDVGGNDISRRNVISNQYLTKMNNKTYQAFLSHSNPDKPLVEYIANWLTQNDITVWLDKWNILPGDPWQEEIEDALDASSACVVFLGTGGITPWQNEEMRSAINDRVSDQSIRVIPVLLPSATQPQNKKAIPRFLKRLSWLEFGNSVEDENKLQLLKRAILNDRKTKPILSVSKPAPEQSKPLTAEQTLHFKQQIAQGNVKKVLEELLLIFQNQQAETYDELVQLSHRAQSNEKNERLGIVEKSVYNIERNQITEALLAFLNR